MSATVIRVKTADHEREVLPAKRTNLYLATLIVNIAVLSMGSLYGWSSPSIPKLRASDSWLPLDTQQASWVGSLIALGSIFGPFLGGWLVNQVGRRPTIVVAVATGLMSMAVLYQAETVWEVYVSRIVGGVGGGITFAVVPLYVAEIAEDEVRSALTSLFNCSLMVGMLLSYCVGPYVSYWTLIWVCSAAPVVFLLLCPWLPESPHFLLMRSQEHKAYQNLSWFRKGVPQDQVVEEVKAIQESIEDAKKSKGTFFDLFRTHGNRRALLITIGLMMFQQLSGINVVIFYSQTIFEMAGRTSLSPSESTILVGVILLLAAAAAVPLTHLFGIKNMLLVSAVGMTVSLTLLGLYFFLLAEGTDISSFSWLPIVSLIGYVIIYSVGFGPLPWAVMAEVFPPNVKGIASAVVASFSWAMGFMLTKLFPILTETLGTHFVFWSFAFSSFLAFFFTCVLVPDTRGMSLQGIQDLLNQPPTTLYKDRPNSSNISVR